MKLLLAVLFVFSAVFFPVRSAASGMGWGFGV
jgi:hypothetical protein